MASPVAQEAVESSTNTAGTSHVVTLPTATAGQLLLIILDKGSTAATINAHGSLTVLLDENLANGLYIAYRWMDGTEPASYTLTSSASTRSARIAYRISGAENPATQAPQIGATSSGSTATPDPPVSATPGSSKDYLFIAFYGAAGEEADDDTWSDTPPTNYTPSPPRQKTCGTAGTNLGGMIAAAERALTTGSAENPGTFAKDVSAAWRAQTIMITPSSSVTFPKTLAATEVSVLTLGRTNTFARALSVVEAGILSLRRGLFSVLSVQSPGVATLVKANLISKVLAAITTGVATIGRALVFGKSVIATLVAVASVVSKFVIGKTLTVTEVSVVTLGRYRTFGSPFLFTEDNWSATFYLEVHARATSGTLKARLYNLTDSTPVADSEVSTTSSTFVRLRSAAVSLVDGKEYAVQFGTVDGVGGFKAARIIAV